MIQKNGLQKDRLKRMIILAIIMIAGALLTGVVHAQVGGISFFTKAGDPTELIADGKSQTRLMMDLSGCVWYPTAISTDLLQIELTTSLGLTASPPSISGTIGEKGSPYEIILQAGSQPGYAKITANASFCKEGNVMVFGICSSQEEQNTPKCTGEFEILLVSTDSSGVEENSSEESEESEDLSVSISCPPRPKKGESVTCTANVSGAKENETLEYIWSLEGSAGDKTRSSTYNWKGEESGYYEVSVEVFGDDRSAKNSFRANVQDTETSSEEDQNDDSTGSEDSETTGLVNSLEMFLKASGVGNIDPARLAAAGTGVSALIAIWMIVQHRSGVPMEKLESAIGKWRWREGGELPETKPEVETTPDKPPEKLPEAEKTDKGDKPTSLPEQKDPDDGAKVPASASSDKPTSDDPASAPPSKAKKTSGETGEERIERAVDDAEDLRAALDKTIADFKKVLEKVPKGTKDSEFWKQKVAPKLKKLDDLGLAEKSGKLKEFLRITKELLQVRKQVDAELAVFSKEDREGVVWLVRGLQAGQEGLSKIHKQLITDPAISAAKAGLPKEQAAAVEKFLNKHQTEIETMLKGIKDLPINLGNKMGKAMRLDQNVGIVKKDTVGVLHEKWKHKYKGFDITQSPREKLGPVIKYVEETGAAIKKKLGRTFIFLRDTTPKKE